MGYRNYFFSVKKSLIKELQECKNIEEVYELYKRYGFLANMENISEEETYYYCPLRSLPKQIFEFGKYYEAKENVSKKGAPLFINDNVAEYYKEEDAVYGGEEMILEAIDYLKNQIIKMYENLLNNTFNNEYEKIKYSKIEDKKEAHYQRLLLHVKDYLNWWKPEYGNYSAVNLDKNSPSIVTSWLYEHEIFELVKVYKEYNPEEDYILFLGW